MVRHKNWKGKSSSSRLNKKVTLKLFLGYFLFSWDLKVGRGQPLLAREGLHRVSGETLFRFFSFGFFKRAAVREYLKDLTVILAGD